MRIKLAQAGQLGNAFPVTSDVRDQCCTSRLMSRNSRSMLAEGELDLESTTESLNRALQCL
jgi:hypothetical protein